MSSTRQHNNINHNLQPQPFQLNKPPLPEWNNIDTLNNNPFIQSHNTRQLSIPNNISYRNDSTLNSSDDDINSTINSPMPSYSGMSSITHTPNTSSQLHTITSGKRLRGKSMADESLIDDSPELSGITGNTQNNGPYNSLKLRRKLRKNTREKQRRTELNDQFDVLTELLHLNSGHGKVEKYTVLSEAIQVIEKLNHELMQLKNERYEIKKELSKLTSVLQSNATPTNQHDIQQLQSIQQRFFPVTPPNNEHLSRNTSQSTSPHTVHSNNSQHTMYSYPHQPPQDTYQSSLYQQQSHIPLQINTAIPDSFATMSVSTPPRNTTPTQQSVPIEPNSPAYTYNSAPAAVSPNHTQSQRTSHHSALYQTTSHQSTMPTHHRTLSRSSSGTTYTTLTQPTQQQPQLNTSTQSQYPPLPAVNSISFPQYNRPASVQTPPLDNTVSNNTNKSTIPQQSYQSQFSPSQLSIISPTSHSRTFNFTQPTIGTSGNNANNSSTTQQSAPQQPVFQYSRHRRGTGSFGSGFAFGSGSFNFNFTNNNNNNSFMPPVISNTPLIDSLPTLDELTPIVEQENNTLTNTNNIDMIHSSTNHNPKQSPVPQHQRRPSFNNYSHNRNLSVGLYGTNNSAHQRMPSLNTMMSDSLQSPTFNAQTPIIQPAIQKEDIL